MRARRRRCSSSTDVWVAGDRGDDAVRGVTLRRARRRDRRRRRRRRQRPARARRGDRRDAAAVARARSRSTGKPLRGGDPREAIRAGRRARARGPARTPASRRASASPRTSCSSPTATATLAPGRCSGSARSASGPSQLIQRLRRRGAGPAAAGAAALGRQPAEGRARPRVLGLAARARRRLADARPRRRRDRDRALATCARRADGGVADPADQRGPRRDPRARRPHRRHVRGPRSPASSTRATATVEEIGLLMAGRRAGRRSAVDPDRAPPAPAALADVRRAARVARRRGRCVMSVVLLVDRATRPVDTFRRIVETAFTSKTALNETLVSATPLALHGPLRRGRVPHEPLQHRRRGPALRRRDRSARRSRSRSTARRRRLTIPAMIVAGAARRRGARADPGACCGRSSRPTRSSPR